VLRLLRPVGGVTVPGSLVSVLRASKAPVVAAPLAARVLPAVVRVLGEAPAHAASAALVLGTPTAIALVCAV
jgi:hypothetical protein